MKKLLLLSLIAGIFILAFVSASQACTNAASIGGLIYEQSNNNPVSGANVEVTCNNVTLTTSSNSAGHYNVLFTNGVCDFGDNVNVKAVKNSLTGDEIGSVNMGPYQFGCGCDLSVGLVDVPMIPEFGFILGGITIFASVIAFFVIRRH